MYGTCKICGCTDNNACIHLDFGNCFWLHDDHELCSHCVELADDPGVERPKLDLEKMMSDFILENTGFTEPTMNLRFRDIETLIDKKTARWDRVLQQLWINTITGQTEWINVPLDNSEP